MKLNAFFVTFYLDVVFTAVDNYVIAISSTSITPRPKALADASTRAVEKLQAELDAAGAMPTQAQPSTSPTPVASSG
jgi:hypothetical protein